jgi:hypothetical protein
MAQPRKQHNISSDVTVINRELRNLALFFKDQRVGSAKISRYNCSVRANEMMKEVRRQL